MTLDELLENWKADAEIDRTELGNEAIKIPQLHSKYFKFYSTERLALRKLEEDAKVLKKQKYEWFNGSMDYEDLNDLGWSPNPLKLLRADIPQYIDADKDIVSLNLKIAYQKEKVDFLDSAIRSLNTRGYNLRAAIDWEKFKMGGI
jgi:hypothetical protein